VNPYNPATDAYRRIRAVVSAARRAGLVNPGKGFTKACYGGAMATIHRTTLTPAKLELLTGWLPSQPWYSATRQRPELTRAGGFRLDDPEGEVGIEFMVVIDGQDSRATAYLVPLTYRGSAREDSGEGLIGTAEHGVLGQRWVYDGTRDPVLVAQLVALIQGAARPQAQSQSDTPDPTVHSRPAASGPLATAGFTVTSDSPDGTDLRVEAGESGALALRIHRILTPMDGAGDEGSVTATWQTPDGARVRGVFVTAAASAAHR
jgi:Maltokinase N-terminal cap domain